MESGHFLLVVADVEGRVMKFNKGFEKININPTDIQFSEFLSPNSSEEFNYSLELMLGSPKIRRHLMLEHPTYQSEGLSQVWWEFSVVTTSDMDISGIIGIGVGLQFLEQDMPWNNLVDVLGFGEILLDTDFKIKSWDEKILGWFDPKIENWLGSNFLDVFSFQDMNQIQGMITQISLGDKPRCFLMSSKYSEGPTFAALLTVSKDGYHLFLTPKSASFNLKPEKPLIPQQTLSLFKGAVFVLNKFGKVIQQNPAANNLARFWRGSAFSEGYSMSFPDQSKRFSKLLKAIDEAQLGKCSEVDLKIMIQDQGFGFWQASVKPIFDDFNQPEGVLIQVEETTQLESKLNKALLENERLKEIALSPSHILRGPLSSMIGILELLDTKVLDKENQKLFSYLKPLTKELDHIIRQHSKRMSAFD